MNGSRSLRPSTPADTPLLLSLTRSTGVFRDDEIDALDDVLTDYHRESADCGHLCCTLLLDDAVAGFGYLAPVAMTDRTWELWWLAVAPAHQGQGAGQWLLDRLESLVVQQRGRVLFIETSSLPHYAATRQFYLKRGYTEVAILPDYYQPGDDKVVYRKLLGQGLS